MKINKLSVCGIFIICNMMISSCKKNTLTPDKPSQQDTCSAKIADAENIEIFPSDNAWNNDVSSLPVDPYS
ncbi:MAG: hypothetical protein ABI261_04210, partial [Ginsengibacter sp.]